MGRGRSRGSPDAEGSGSQLDPTLFRGQESSGAMPVAVGEMDLDERGFGSRYVAQAPLGVGGMGEVRLCLDTRIGRAVAMKLVRLPQLDPVLRERFLREAQVQAQLDHPAVVPVYDMGLAPDGGAFFTMKRVRGDTLASILARLREQPEAQREYSPRKLLTAFSRVCLAVDFAHQRRVLHRDLKPANLMLGDFGEVYLLDWGIAAVRSGPEADRETVAAQLGLEADAPLADAGIFGTPGYLAPEMLRGEPADQRSEVYSLCAILFEILTLQPLHPGDGTQRIESTRAGADARASIRAPDRDVPPELEALCVAGCSSDPAARPPSARVIADQIDRYLDGDRDLELRRQLAADQAEEAALAADRALGSNSIEDRRAALASVGRALAFDPHNRNARSVLVKLLTEPPRELPGGALREYGLTELQDAQRAGRFAAVAYAAAIPIGLVPMALMGIRDPLLLVFGFGLLAIASVLGVVLARLNQYYLAVPLALFFTSTSGLAMAGFTFGPFVLAPTIVGINAMAYMFHGRVPPWVTIPFALATILVPALLEWYGVIPPAYVFEAGEIRMLPRQVEFSPLAAMISLASSSAAAIVLGSTYAWYVHRGLTDIRRRLHLQAWQLEQAMSEEGATGRPDGPPARSLPRSG